jgi:DNA processing protein
VGKARMGCINKAQKELILNSRALLLALNHVSGMGPKTIHRLLQRWPHLPDILRVEKQNLPPALFQAIQQLPWQKVDDDLKWCEHPNHHILTCIDSDYPKLLLETVGYPPVLYLKGNLKALNHVFLAMVGTRRPTVYGKNLAFEWGAHFVNEGIGLVSGLALGIDSMVHLACVKNHGVTIAVLGSGVDWVYPKKNVALADKIQENGLLISEFSRKLPPNPGQFPRRNRIISGLALCTLVVEAAERSGSLITADYAVEQNREVFAIPGPVGNSMSLGCHRLLQQGARLAAVPEDVLSEYALN